MSGKEVSASVPEYFVVGITHVDLAWKRGRAEMSEMLEIVVTRLLDLLEQNPDFCYHLEQAAHFRALQQRRPDLITRLKPFLQSGRLEFVGGMASTLESNLPNGECFIRNQQIGLQWVRDTWNVEVKTGWLVDTFGIPAQAPQILKGFGITQCVANRFGGSHTRDLFRARSLDGSEVTVAGWGTYAAYIYPENVAEQFCKNWDDIDQCFARADLLTGPGPYLVIPYTENEMLISQRPQQLVEERRRERPEQTWRMATPAAFFDALAKTGRILPVVEGDLNPEFTGCFSLRSAIRLRNRRVETRLMEAEKWAALTRRDHDTASAEKALDEAWWELAYVQFHDVFTGSHPTAVFHDVMRVLGNIEATADAVLAEAFARITPREGEAAKEDLAEDTAFAVVFNGLPWDRRDIAEIPLPSGWTSVTRVTDARDALCAFALEENVLRIRSEVPATGYTTLRLERGAGLETHFRSVDAAVLENEWICLEFDQVQGVAKLVWKPTGEVLLENAGNWLVAQRDDGNFQIENPNGPEVAAATGTLHLEENSETPLGKTVRLSGEFPPLSWAGAQHHLRWSAKFFLPTHRPEVRLSLHLDWQGEATRMRLTLPTLIDSSTGIYEVPFGVVQRKPYTPRTNAKGEWPAHRFVAVEDSRHGMALINTGVGGVEVNGGTIYTTVLRAPRGEYAGMVADATSSQHGSHDYTFVLKPYAGSLAQSGVVQATQESNNPLLPDVRLGEVPQQATASFLRVEPGNVVLSGVKAASDDPGDVIIRVYETAGQETEALLTFPGAARAWTCDLRENMIGTEVILEQGELRFVLKPFEIRTFRFPAPPCPVIRKETLPSGVS